MPMRISRAVTPGALAIGVVAAAGGSAAGIHLVAGAPRAAVACAAAAAARPSAPERTAVDSTRSTVRRCMSLSSGGGIPGTADGSEQRRGIEQRGARAGLVDQLAEGQRARLGDGLGRGDVRAVGIVSGQTGPPSSGAGPT